MVKVEDIIKQISETGYKTYDGVLQEYNEMIEKSKQVQPNTSDESRQAFVLNQIFGKAPHPITIKGYIIGMGSEFDQNKKHREAALKAGVVNELGQLIFSGMPEKRKFLNDKVIPSAEESTTRICYYVGTQVKEDGEENWKKSILRTKKGQIPVIGSLSEFKGIGSTKSAVPNINTLLGTQFKVLSNDWKFDDQMVAIFQENLCKFEDVAIVEPPKNYPILVFQGQVTRITQTRDEVTSNVIEVRMPAETLEDVIRADSVDNLTLWCDKAISLNMNEGDLVWIIANKLTKQDGTITLNGLGFFVEGSSFPVNAPLPITEETIKTEKEGE